MGQNPPRLLYALPVLYITGGKKALTQVRFCAVVSGLCFTVEFIADQLPPASGKTLDLKTENFANFANPKVSFCQNDV